MSRLCNNFLEFGIEEEIDPKIKFNSLISVTVSTIMCVAAKCPLPKSNIETTKLFLSTITDERGQTPRNIKGFLTLLSNYTGPYEPDPSQDSHFEKAVVEKPQPKPADENSLCPLPRDFDVMSKTSATQIEVTKEEASVVESHTLIKRSAKSNLRRSDKEPKKKDRSLTSKISTSKSMITKF